MLRPAGLRNRDRIVHKINTWDKSGEQIIEEQMRSLEPMLGLEIRQGYLVPIHPIDKLQKANISTGTAAAYNALFGSVGVIQFSQQHNAIGMLPKRGYPREGFRAYSAAAIASGAGIAEGSAVATAVVPTPVEITVGLKELEVVTEFTTRMEVVSKKNDTLEFEGVAQIVFSNFMEALDTDLLVDMDTLAGDNHESLDRVCGSSGENTALGYTAADEDLHGVDRSANTWFDGNSDHASGVDRTVSKALIDALMRDQWEYWGNDLDNKAYLTGTDTWVEWSAIEGARQRMGQDTFITNINGMQTFKGMAGGYKLTTYDNIGIMLDNNVAVDTISRLMLLDLNHVGQVIGRPLEFIESDNPFEVGHTHRGLWYGIHESWADLPISCGKVRDLKTA